LSGIEAQMIAGITIAKNAAKRRNGIKKKHTNSPVAVSSAAAPMNVSNPAYANKGKLTAINVKPIKISPLKTKKKPQNNIKPINRGIRYH